MSNPLLSDQEAQFVNHYLVLGKATEAARRAGYSESFAKKKAYQLLKRETVAAAIEAGTLIEHQEELSVSRQQAISVLSAMVLATPDMLMDQQDGMAMLSTIGVYKHAIREFTVVKDAEGRHRRTTLKFWNKASAVRELRLMGALVDVSLLAEEGQPRIDADGRECFVGEEEVITSISVVEGENEVRDGDEACIEVSQDPVDRRAEATDASREGITPLRRDDGAGVTPLREDDGSSVTPLREDDGSSVTPLREDDGSSVTPLREDDGGSVTPLREDDGSSVTPLREDDGGSVTPLREDDGAVPGMEDSAAEQETTRCNSRSLCGAIEPAAGASLRFAKVTEEELLTADKGDQEIGMKGSGVRLGVSQGVGLGDDESGVTSLREGDGDLPERLPAGEAKVGNGYINPSASSGYEEHGECGDFALDANDLPTDELRRLLAEERQREAYWFAQRLRGEAVTPRLDDGEYSGGGR